MQDFSGFRHKKARPEKGGPKEVGAIWASFTPRSPPPGF